MTSPSDEEEPPLMPVRRLHNYVYCPRLFYLQWVEGVFVPNEDTVEGSGIHKRVDSPDVLRGEMAPEGHLHSVAISSEKWGLTGVVDLLEAEGEGGKMGQGRRLVDYKKGSPLRNSEGEWAPKPNDAVQIAAYTLMLRDVGVPVSGASIYYAEIRRHVEVPLTEELFSFCLKMLEQARQTAASGICPPPLCCASRCFRCSAYPVCLPFETRYGREGKGHQEDESPIRAPMPEQDAGEILVVQNNRAFVGLQGGEIVVRLDGEKVSSHPLHQLTDVFLYGPVQVSAQALQMMMEKGISVSYFSPSGRYVGMSHGLPCSGVDARLGQARLWACPEKRCSLAAEMIRAKIHNQRVILMRNGSAPKMVLKELAFLRDSCASQTSLPALRGVEGAAASCYFSQFSTMLKSDMGFAFKSRNRRPPRDAVNSLLSLAYSVLVKEMCGIAHAVGLDPFLGFFHSPRYGRPALALDMMEEFRPLLADSVVLTMVNRGEVTPDDFVATTRGTFLKEEGRRQFWRAWIRRMDTEVRHPVFGYKMSYRRMMIVQMRQFWRFCRGESAVYHGFTTR